MLPCAALATAAAQQQLVVPAAYATTDAPAYGWLAGASRDVRQQTLIGASHLAPMLGQTLTALELRRHAANEIYQGGVADLTLTLSIAPHGPLACSTTFAANVGPNPVQVFAGQVTLPTSPAPTGPTMDWTPDNIVRIEFTTPFAYTGGTLCVDLIGHPVAGQNANWWMADLELEDIAGTTTDLGGGCGLYGGIDKDWSSVSRRSLLPGAYARFSAYGTPLGLAIAAFGQKAPFGTPLAWFGLPAGPGCDLHLATLDGLVPTLFVPPNDPGDLSFGGEAEVQFKLPSSASVFGLSMTTQWIDWAQMATSNAIEWTIASAMPTVELALIEGHPTEATGLAAVYMGHVFRFEFQ